MAKLIILLIKAKMILFGALTVSLVLGRDLPTFCQTNMAYIIYGSYTSRLKVWVRLAFGDFKKGHATFEDWAVQFEKTYSSDAELKYRKQVWEKTLIKIEKHNAELLEGKHTYGMGLNQFSDLTPEEFRMLYLTPREHLEDPQPVRQVNRGNQKLSDFHFI